MALNRASVSQPITINADMSYPVRVQFWDSADPLNSGVVPPALPVSVLWEETVTVPASATTAQLQAVVLARGSVIKQGLANQAAARAQVPLGTAITIP
jgi:hypothetical protein